MSVDQDGINQLAGDNPSNFNIDVQFFPQLW